MKSLSKSLSKIIWSLIMPVAVFLMMIHAPELTVRVSADEIVYRISQVPKSNTETTVKVKWKTFDEFNGIDKEDPNIERKISYYTLESYSFGDDGKLVKDNVYSKKFSETGAGEYTAVMNLKKNYVGQARIAITYKEYKNNEYVGEKTDDTLHCCPIDTKPSKPKTDQFGLSNPFAANKMVIKSWFKVNRPAVLYSTQLELHKGNDKGKIYNLEYSISDSYKIQKGYAYQYRVRYYIYNNSSKEYDFSPWSQWKGFVVPKNVSVHSYSNKKGFKLTLSKINGVTKYKIYTSLKKTGFKKPVTVNAKKKKKYSVQITKKYKKGKKNYIKITPYINLSHYKGDSDFSMVTPKPIKIYK